MNLCKPHVWRLAELFNSTYPYGLLLLNHSVTPDTVTFLRKLWYNAQARVCVDGGTNNYHKIMQSCVTKKHQFSQSSSPKECSQSLPKNQESGNGVHSVGCDESSATSSHGLVPLPDFICGDFDSVEPDILQHYTDLGVEIVPTPDQNDTDFTKALKQLGIHLLKQSQSVHHVLVAASISHDRFDHVIANINTLHKCPLSVPVLIVSPSTVLLLLQPGRHELVIPRYHTPDLAWCGYAPIAGPATVTTSGLKWDVSDTVVQFGGLVSTSNHFAEDCSSAFITTDQPLLFMFNHPPGDDPDAVTEDTRAASEPSAV